MPTLFEVVGLGVGVFLYVSQSLNIFKKSVNCKDVNLNPPGRCLWYVNHMRLCDVFKGNIARDYSRDPVYRMSLLILLVESVGIPMSFIN
jgi:hypothetical protein